MSRPVRTSCHLLSFVLLASLGLPQTSHIAWRDTWGTTYGVVNRFTDVAAQDLTLPGQANITAKYWAEVLTPSHDALMFNGGITSSSGAFLEGLPTGVTLKGYVSFYAVPGCDSPIGVISLQGSGVGDDNDRALCWGHNSIRRESDASTATGFPANTRYKTLFRSRFNSAQQGIVLAKMVVGTAPTETTRDALVRFDLQSTGCAPPSSQTEHILIQKGDSIPGPGIFASFLSTEKRAFDFNDRGDYMFIGTFQSPNPERVVLNSTWVLRNGQMVPGGIGQIQNLDFAALDLNDLGDFVIQVSSTAGAAIVRGSTVNPAVLTKVAQEGDVVPDPSLGSFTLTRVGRKQTSSSAVNWAPVLLTNGGDVLWYGEWNEADTAVNGGIFLNDRLLVRKGSTHDGLDLEEIGSQIDDLRHDIDVSPNGRFLVYEAITDQGQAVFITDLGEVVPYGTVAQGCSNPYPDAHLDHTPSPGLFFPTDLPLVGEKFELRIGLPGQSWPAGTGWVKLVFRFAPNPNYPCGAVLPGYELLVGSTEQLVIPARPVPSSPPMTFTIPIDGSVLPLGLFNQVSYVQAFYIGAPITNPPTILGATNAVRIVYGGQ